MATLCANLMHQMSGATEFASFFNDRRRRSMLRAVFDAYYEDTSADKVVFDTNRNWTAKMALLDLLYPEARVICCVREVAWILDSIERLVRRNALQPSRMFNHKTSGSIYSRVDMLMEPEKGLVGLAWSSLREAWFGECAARLIVINYNSLVRHPDTVMRHLYSEIGEPPFNHDFNNVTFDVPLYDAEIGMPGLHEVRRKIEYVPRKSCLPPDLVAKFADVNFWLNPGLNSRNVTIL